MSITDIGAVFVDATASSSTCSQTGPVANSGVTGLDSWTSAFHTQTSTNIITLSVKRRIAATVSQTVSVLTEASIAVNSISALASTVAITNQVITGLEIPGSPITCPETKTIAESCTLGCVFAGAFAFSVTDVVFAFFTVDIGVSAFSVALSCTLSLAFVG